MCHQKSGILLETVDRGTSNETLECGNVTVTRKRSKKTQGKWRERIEGWDETEEFTFWFLTVLSIVIVKSVCDLVS